MTIVGRVLSSGKGAPFVILAVSALVMAPALLLPDATVHGDFYVYARWQAHFARAFAAGDPWPRWLPDLNQGFGSPAFFIYPPLGQWLGALLVPLLPGAGFAGQRLIVALTLTLALSGVGLFAWLRLVGLGVAAALVGALAWLLLPYHAYLDLYQRGAFAELIAMAALPWGMAFAHALQQRRLFAWGGLTVSLAALLYANAPTAMFGAPFIGLYAVLLADRGQRLRLLALVGTAGLVALAIAAAWLGPALTQVGLVNERVLFNDIYQPANYLIFSPTPWPNQGVRIAATLIFLLHAAIFALAVVAGGKGRGRTVMIVAMLLLFLAMSEPSRPIWIAAMPWSKIQFAWRLLGLQTLLLAGLIGMAWQSTAGKKRGAGRVAIRWLLPALLLVDALLLAALVYHVEHRPAWPTSEIAAPRAEVREYWLGDVDRLVRGFGEYDSIAIRGDEATGPLERHGRFAALDVRARTPALIAVRQFAYSGWIARIDGGAWRQTGRLVDPRGVVTVAVPAGRHRVELAMPQLFAESRGILLSWVGLGLLFLGLIADPARRLLAR